MIHIISGWTKPGGSTEAFINLTNAFNEVGYDCCFYGKDNFPENKCLFKNISELKINLYDIVISHFIKPTKFNCKKHILSCHESELFLINKLNYTLWDKIHFVSDWQKNYHNINHPNFICPNITKKLIPSDKSKVKGIYSIIGSIDFNKQTHVSIQKALINGAKKILIYGKYDENCDYFKTAILPYVVYYSNIIKLMGFEDNKQKMYDSCEKVYLNSLKETWGFLIPECKMTNTELICGVNINKNIEIWDEEKIINKWKKELELC